MSHTVRPRRSVLYMPGSNARALEKAKGLDADVLIFDLEDAVAPDAKELAREQVCRAAQSRAYGHREVVIRINALTTEWGEADLEAAANAAPDAILVPKVSEQDDVFASQAVLDKVGCSADVKLWAMIETPLSILNARDIAATAKTDAGSRLSCFVAGTNDLAKDTKAHLVGDRYTMLPWLQTCLAAARAFGLSVLDGVFNNIDDYAGFAAECQQGLELGFDGKTLIHPRQVEICNQIFSPMPDDVAFARKIIEAFSRPENQTRGALRLDGRMVERLHADMARDMVAIADAIAGRS
ncbi:HpcH/HpaI aldolase/citrate lyase family protein [Coralliovum pocilloporae]|uniref:HpcH/HpaI aldolase/citrate lyase family protein n=1 Tax=Coralliovum pocilloporae TaxID=3066369 RepID=UPI003306B736